MCKKITLFLPSLRGGGAERVLVILANAFSKRGYSVDLVLSDAVGPYLSEVSNTVRVVNLGCARISSSIPGLALYLRREQPDALLSAMGHTNVAALLARQISHTSTKIVVSERSCLSASLAHARNSKSRLVAWLMRRLYRRADGIIAISNGVADDLAPQVNLPRERITVVHNPLDIERVQSLSVQVSPKLLFGNAEGPLIVAAGRLVEQKGFITLLRAFKKLRSQRAARLCILGEGPLRPQLESEIEMLQIAKDVILPGFFDNPYSIMRKADMFVLSSGWEGFGNVLVEAMACGTPIVSTDCPSGPSEILENGRWGRIVPVADADALAEAMAATLHETKHPDVVARAAEFSVDRAVDGYLKVMLPE